MDTDLASAQGMGEVFQAASDPCGSSSNDSTQSCVTYEASSLGQRTRLHESRRPASQRAKWNRRHRKHSSPRPRCPRPERCVSQSREQGGRGKPVAWEATRLCHGKTRTCIQVETHREVICRAWCSQGHRIISVRQLIHAHAGSVARAVIGAPQPLARSPGKAWEALALPGIPIANAVVRALPRSVSLRCRRWDTAL